MGIIARIRVFLVMRKIERINREIANLEHPFRRVCINEASEILAQRLAANPSVPAFLWETANSILTLPRIEAQTLKTKIDSDFRYINPRFRAFAVEIQPNVFVVRAQVTR